MGSRKERGSGRRRGEVNKRRRADQGVRRWRKKDNRVFHVSQGATCDDKYCMLVIMIARLILQ